MALVAYRVGAEWIRISKGPGSSAAAETPSPAQLVRAGRSANRFKAYI